MNQVYRQKFFLAVQHSCLSLKIIIFLLQTHISGLLEKISGNIPRDRYITGIFLLYSERQKYGINSLKIKQDVFQKNLWTGQF
jgi:hypothetical protein